MKNFESQNFLASGIIVVYFQDTCAELSGMVNGKKKTQNLFAQITKTKFKQLDFMYIQTYILLFTSSSKT